MLNNPGGTSELSTATIVNATGKPLLSQSAIVTECAAES